MLQMIDTEPRPRYLSSTLPCLADGDEMVKMRSGLAVEVNIMHFQKEASGKWGRRDRIE